MNRQTANRLAEIRKSIRDGDHTQLAIRDLTYLLRLLSRRRPDDGEGTK